MAGQQGEGEFVYEYEDAAALEEILGDRYPAVVANPPYITVKDPALNAAYRSNWDACHREYALSVPFAQRLFDLAIPGGFTGQITSNSFMKREFGRKLIEKFFPTVDLTLVIDTSGAYIPGHGTPTVIICGRNCRPVAQTVRAVLGIRGEPKAPADPAKGFVWSAIVDNVDTPGSQTEYVSVSDVKRQVLLSYPWSLSGGGAADLMGRIDASIVSKLEDVGRAATGAVTREDGVYLIGAGALQRAGVASEYQRVLVEGDEVRDWYLHGSEVALWPYDAESLSARLDADGLRHLWPYRVQLRRRVAFAENSTSA